MGSCAINIIKILMADISVRVFFFKNAIMFLNQFVAYLNPPDPKDTRCFRKYIKMLSNKAITTSVRLLSSFEDNWKFVENC